MELSLIAEQPVKKRKIFIDHETIGVIKTIPELSRLSNKITEIMQGSVRMSETLLMELDLFIANTYNTLKNENVHVDENIIKSLLVLMKILIDGKQLHEIYGYQPLMNNLVKFLEIISFNNETKETIAQICEQFLLLTIDLLNPECRVCLYTLYYLLNLALNQTNRKYEQHLQRLWELKHYFRVIDFAKINDDKFQKLFSQTIITPNFIENQYGQIIIAHILLNPSMKLKSIKDKIYDLIPEISESQASGYGEIYFNAWNIGEGSLKEQIEEVFIQDIMERALICERDDLNRKSLGSKFLAMLSTMHNKNIYKFNIALTNLYKPLLWRYLKSSKSHERCNAAEILYRAFPLMESGEVRLVLSPLREKQIKYMFDLLSDESADVRIIAVKGVCHCLSHRFDYFSDAHITQFLETILEKLLHDKSHEVRAGVFIGFEIMTCEPRSALILFKLLPHIGKYIKDGSEKVRASFVSYLIKLKENLPKQVNFWKVLALMEPISLLVNDTPVIAKLIVKLVMDYFYNKSLPEIVSFSRLVRLTNFNVMAPKLLFTYAQGVIDSADAFKIISSIINKLYVLQCTHIKNITHVSQKENAKKKICEDISNQLDDDKELISGSDDVPDLINKTKIISGLILSAATLFSLYKKDMLLNDYFKDNFNTLSIDFIQCFSQLYKDSPVYYAVVTYASNIPLAKLMPTVNIIDNCLTELKEVNEETHIEIIKALSQSLISWGQSEDVITLAISWLDNSLKFLNLNMQKIKNCKTSKQHTNEGSKLNVTLKLLTCIFDGNHCQYRLKENNNSIINLYKCLDQVKLLIEKRLTKGSSAVKDESDQYVQQYYKTLLTVQCYMPVTTRFDELSDNKQFTANTVLIEHVKWLNSFIIMYLSQKKIFKSYTISSLPLTCLAEFLLMVKKHLQIKVTDDEYIKAVAGLVINCLHLEFRYHLLEVSIELLKILTEYNMSLKSDSVLHQHLQVHILPMLLNRILEVLKEGNFAAHHNIFKYLENVDNMLDSLFLYLNYSKRRTSLMNFKNTLNTYICAVVDIVLLKERKVKKLNLHPRLEELPFLASCITKKLIEEESFVPYIMTSINELISNHNEDALFIRNCLSLLYTLACCMKQKFNREEFEKCLIHANGVLCTIKTPSSSSSCSTDLQVGNIIQQGTTIIKLISSKLASSTR